MIKNDLLLLLFSVGLLTGCSQAKKNNNSEPVEVKAMTVSLVADASDNSYVGTVEESYGSQLSFATIGTVAQVFVDEGKAVSKGERLAVLDKSSIQNSYEIALSTLKQAEDAYNRLNTLYKKGSLPEVKYVEIQTQLAQARSGERIARKNLDDCVLRAPFSGYISKRSVDIGNNVGPGVGCFDLVKIDKVKVKVAIPEKEIASIKIGQKVKFSVDALGSRNFYGIVREKGVQANPLSHTYDIKLELENYNHLLLPGMVCSVLISTTGAADNIVIPQDAIMVDGAGTFVWTAKDGKAHRQDITSDGVNDSGTIVRSGIASGDKIIVSGQNKVSEGTKIKDCPN